MDMDQAMNWRRSTRCDSNSCVEVSPGSLRVAVRDSAASGAWLTFDRGDWNTFVRDLRRKED